MTPRGHFWCGLWAAIGIIMAYQDSLGLEGYIERVRQGWVELPWGVGALIAIIAIWVHVTGRRS